MSRLNLRVHALARPEGRDDEGLCHDLVEVLRGAVKKRAAPPVAVVLRDGRTDLFQFEAVREAAIPIPNFIACLLYTSPSPRDKRQSRMPSSA